MDRTEVFFIHIVTTQHAPEKCPAGGGALRESGVASSRAKFFEDPNCVGVWLGNSIWIMGFVPN